MEEAADLEVLRDLADETLEGELSDKKLSRLLVAANFAQCHRSGAETMGLLHTSSCGLGKSTTELGTDKSKDALLTAAVLRADDLAASCLRGALPEMRR